jgi:thioredoxin 1
MELIKFEKDNCGPCTMVSNYLDENKVSYKTFNPFNGGEDARLAAKYQIGMTVPVTVLVDEAGEKVELSRGYKPPELDALIAQLK